MGILPFYVLKKFSTSPGKCLEAKAYLTVPLYQTSILPDMNGGSMSGWAVDSVFDPSVLRGLTEIQMGRFKDVMRLLRLRSLDLNEDESAFIDQREWLDHISNNRDSYSGPASDEHEGSDDEELVNNSSQSSKTEDECQIKEVKPELMILGTGDVEYG